MRFMAAKRRIAASKRGKPLLKEFREPRKIIRPLMEPAIPLMYQR
jgi:hypothetical protein